MSGPLVSIVIPVYNGANYMREAIDSALAQIYPLVEVIVVNDGSTDGGRTEQIALSYGGRIRYFAKENGGVATALNLGAREMRGEYFCWLSHDDVFLREKVASQVELLNALPDGRRGVILYGDFEVIDGSSRRIGLTRVPDVPPAAMRYQLLASYPVHGCTTLIPRHCFERVGYFDEALRTTQDVQFWFRAAGPYVFRHAPGAHTQSRSHREQGIFTIPEHAAQCEDLFRWMLDRLTEDELLAGAGGGSAALAYIKLAWALRLVKRAPRSMRQALALGGAALARERGADRLWASACLLAASAGLPLLAGATLLKRGCRRLAREASALFRRRAAR